MVRRLTALGRRGTAESRLPRWTSNRCSAPGTPRTLVVISTKGSSSSIGCGTIRARATSRGLIPWAPTSRLASASPTTTSSRAWRCSKVPAQARSVHGPGAHARRATPGRLPVARQHRPVGHHVRRRVLVEHRTRRQPRRETRADQRPGRAVLLLVSMPRRTIRRIASGRCAASSGSTRSCTTRGGISITGVSASRICSSAPAQPSARVTSTTTRALPSSRSSPRWRSTAIRTGSRAPATSPERSSPPSGRPSWAGTTSKAGVDQVYTSYGAWTSLGDLALYDTDRDTTWLDMARANVRSLEAHLRDADGGFAYRAYRCLDHVAKACDGGSATQVIDHTRDTAAQAWVQHLETALAERTLVREQPSQIPGK